MAVASAERLDGDVLAARLRQDLKHRAAGLRARGVVPAMATVLVGDNPASLSYIGRKHADCAEIGIAANDIRLPAATGRHELLARIARLNADPAIHGFLVQLPLPGGLDEAEALEAVDPGKDMDGLHPVNLGRLLAGRPGLLPCTPAGVLTLLRHHDVPLAGRHVVVIGRGALVGRPLAMLLSMRGVDATVTVAHSRTPDLASLTCQADVIVAAAGHPDLVTAEMVRPGAAVVGVGISYIDREAVSDVADDVAEVARWVTPRHGSVGPLTRAMLLKNLVDIAEGEGG
jgi:methylenetetrahydrofolate dehydrogenase (NADP+)/methenyltetrahydrofolate cyclohydrolase